MAKSTPQLIALVRQKCSVENSQVVTDDEVTSYLNEALASLYDLIVSVDPSYYEAAQDYILASSAAGAIGALPATFYRMRGFLRYPDTTREYPVFLSPFSERRRGRVGYTLDGNSITVVPWDIAGDGPWRLVYTPKAPQLGYDFTADAATIQALPAYNVGGSTLTATSNGALNIDGVTNAGTVVVKDEGNPINNGYYVVTAEGSVASPWILTRGSITNGFRLKVAGGQFNKNKIYVASFTTPGVTPWTWTEQTLDVTMDNYDEYVTNKAALSVFGKRQMDPGLISGLFASAEARVRGMAAGRASEPEQAPILWRGGARCDFDRDW